MVERTLGRYALRKALRPGMVGMVWEGWDEALARRVAVEVVPLGSDDANRSTLVARFQREAQVAGQLTRAGLVQVYDFGETADEAYIVRELFEGESLRQMIDRIGVVPVARAVSIMLGVLDTLEACHRLGIVHREIRPRNILLPGGDRTKLTGFGVPPARDGDATLTGAAWDTTPYASPEQITELSPVDARSDVWSCGVVIYEMLTGRHPFRSAGAAMTGQAIVHDEPEPPSSLRPDLPSALDDVTLRALCKTPAKRFPSMAAFADALRTATAIAPASTMPAAKRPFPLWATLIGASTVVLAAGVALWIGSRPEAPRLDRLPSVAEVAAPSPPAGLPVIPPQSLSQRVFAIPCSTVSATGNEAGGVVSFRGIIGSGAPRSTLDAILAGHPPNSSSLAVREFPSSPMSCRMAEIVRAHAGSKPGYLLLQGDNAPLRPGDDIRVRLRAPAFNGEVRLEDLDGEGSIQHIMEANRATVPRFAAGTTMGLGRKGDDLIGRAADSPGTEMLVAIMTTSPLFTQAPPVTQAAAAYLDALERALEAMQRQGGAISMDAVVLTIVRHSN